MSGIVYAAIDFGTSGTGFAWMHADSEDVKRTRGTVEMRLHWPFAPSGSYPKNYSALVVDGDRKVVAWGWEAVELHRDRVRMADLRYETGFKMDLSDGPAPGDLGPPDPNGPDVSHDPDGPDDPHGEARDTEFLITAILGRTREAALASIAEAGLKDCEVRWCVTVPAIWRDHAKKVMRECAVAAGLPADDQGLIIGFEPEVAALYCNTGAFRADRGQGDVMRSGALEPGVCFTVVDCGGGTVDIASYQVNPDSTLRQLIARAGGRYGAEYTSRGFLSHIMKDRLGYQEAWRLSELSPQAVYDFMAGWERARDGFDPDRGLSVNIPIPVSLYRLLDQDALAHLRDRQRGVDEDIVLSTDEVAKLFDDVVEPVFGKIDPQLAATAAAAPAGRRPLVFLVGGFARSVYLRRRLTQHIGARAEVLFPPAPETAVLVGGVYFCQDRMQIAVRRSAFTYGCAVNAVYDEKLDARRKAEPDEDGILRCANRFEIFIRENDEVGVGEISPPHLLSPLSSSQTEIVFKFYATDKREPRYVDEKGMDKSIGNLRISLDGVMDLPPAQRSVAVRMKFGETQIEAEATCVATGKKASVTLVFHSTKDGR